MFNWGLQRIKSALWQNLWCCTAVWAQNGKDRKGNDIMLHLWSISYAQTHVMFPAFWIPVYILMIWQLWVLILHLKEFRAFHHHNTRGAEEGFVWLLSVLSGLGSRERVERGQASSSLDSSTVLESCVIPNFEIKLFMFVKQTKQKICSGEHVLHCVDVTADHVESSDQTCTLLFYRVTIGARIFCILYTFLQHTYIHTYIWSLLKTFFSFLSLLSFSLFFPSSRIILCGIWINIEVLRCVWFTSI